MVELHESAVQALLSLHVMGVYKQPVPVLQESAVHTLLSSHVMAVETHACVVRLQLLVWQASVGQWTGEDRQPVEVLGQEAGLQKVVAQVGHAQDTEVGVEHVQKPRQSIPHKLV